MNLPELSVPLTSAELEPVSNVLVPGRAVVPDRFVSTSGPEAGSIVPAELSTTSSPVGLR